MTSFLTSLYLLNFKQIEIVHNNEVDCIKLCEKDLCSQGPYRNAKREYFLSKCSKCKQQYRKKDVKYVNKLFMSYRCLFLSWDINQPLIMFFSNGTIVSIELNIGNNTVEKIEIDDNLNGKFIPSKIIDVVMCQNCIFITYSEPKLAVIHMNQSSPSFSTKIFGKKRGKLVGPEPKIITVDLIGPCSKSLERKLSLNLHKDHLLVWWRFSDDDVWPWTPVAYSMERINMLIYSLNDGIEILCTAKVNGELIHAIYSKQHFNQILTLEEVKCKAERNINVCIYEVVQNQCHHVFVSKLPMHGSLLSFDWSSTMDKLIISDSNRLLLIYDLRQKTTIVTYLSFLPKQISWHPENCIAVIIGTNNEVQCFDAALNCISFEMYYSKAVHDIIELNSFFPHHFAPQKILWQKSILKNSCLLMLDSELSSFVFLKFSFGSITRNHISALELISQYLKSNCIDRAILVMRSLSWCHESELMFHCLSKITNFLLRKPLDSHTRSGLELALGTFYNCVDILPERIIKLYEYKIHHIARRFFHHLLRYHQFRTAFSLALNLEAQDLFLDLGHVAKQKGENILALVAFHKAGVLDSSQESCSAVSSASDSNTEYSTSSDKESGYECQNVVPVISSSVNNSSTHQYWLPSSEEPKEIGNWLHLTNETAHSYATLADTSDASKVSGHSICNYNESLFPKDNMYHGAFSASDSDQKQQISSALNSTMLSDLPPYTSEYFTKEPSLCDTYKVTHFGKSNSASKTSKSTKHEIDLLDKNKNLEEQSDVEDYGIANKNVEDRSDDVEDCGIKLEHFGII